MADPCTICSNRKCANGLLAMWWDNCVDSKFTLFPTIYSQTYFCPTCKWRGKDGGWCSMYRLKPSGLVENGNSCGLYCKVDAPTGVGSEGNNG